MYSHKGLSLTREIQRFASDTANRVHTDDVDRLRERIGRYPFGAVPVLMRNLYGQSIDGATDD